MKKLLSSLVFATLTAVCCLAQQSVKTLLETSLYQNNSQTFVSLSTARKGQKVTLTRDGAFWSYGIDDISYHLECKVYRDTCMMSGVQFKRNDASYEQTAAAIIQDTKAFGANRVKDLGSGKRIIYVLNPTQKIITVASFAYALKKVKQQIIAQKGLLLSDR